MKVVVGYCKNYLQWDTLQLGTIAKIFAVGPFKDALLFRSRVLLVRVLPAIGSCQSAARARVVARA